MFDIAGLILTFGGIVYAIFGSSELQPWAKKTSYAEDGSVGGGLEVKNTLEVMEDVRSRRSSIY